MKELKASDLRRFNILNCETGVNDNEHLPCVVTQILKDGVTVNANGREDYYIDLSAVKPIPLNEEWLLKFGFEVDPHDKNVFLKTYRNEHIIAVGRDGSVGLCNSLREWERGTTFLAVQMIEHVHQLQNLFYSLCGEELTIKE